MEPDAGDERERHEGHRGEEEEPASKRNGRHDRVAVRGPSGGADGGNPSDHRAHYGMHAGKDDTGLGWSYNQVRGGLAIEIHQKALVVSVNPAGVVTDVQLTASGER